MPEGHLVSGVPHGSVLGPLLFILYVNDLPRWIKNSMRMFADGTKVWTRVNSQEDSLSLQNDLNSLSKWSDKWLLGLNPAKCDACWTRLSNKVPHSRG